MKKLNKHFYSLMENRGIKRLLRKLFATTNQPHKPELIVLCRFLRENNPGFAERWSEVERPKWHFEPKVVDGKTIGKNLVVDASYITLHHRKERYIAVGTPPLTYHYDDPIPITKEQGEILKAGKAK